MCLTSVGRCERPKEASSVGIQDCRMKKFQLQGGGGGSGFMVGALAQH